MQLQFIHVVHWSIYILNYIWFSKIISNENLKVDKVNENLNVNFKCKSGSGRDKLDREVEEEII